MKTLQQLFVVLGIITFILSINFAPVFAQPSSGVFPLASPEKYGNIQAAPAAGTAQSQFAQLAWGLVKNVRYIIGAVSIALIVYAGIMMIISSGKEDAYATQRSSILYGIIGLAVVGLAGEIPNILQVACPEPIPGQPTIACSPGGFLADPNNLIRSAVLFDQRTRIIITFIKYLIGSIVVFTIVRNGFRIIILGGSEDKIALDKKNLIYSIIGLFMIIVSDTLIRKVFYKVDLSRYPTTGGAKPSIDAQGAVQQLVGFTNFIVSLVGPLAIAALVAGGIMYIISGGDEEKMNRAKRILTAAIIGIIIIYGAFAIVSTFISGNFQAGGA